MSDDVDVGTDRLQETIADRHREAAEAASTGHGRPRWLEYLAVSTALFAVCAAVAALQAGTSANEALYKANQAVLQQTQAVDKWSEYQADSVKKYQQRALATVLAHTGGSPAEVAAANAEAAKRQGQEDALKPEAVKLDAETANLNRESETLLAHHHRYAMAVTVFQVAIGLAAIAALLRLRPLWLLSVGAGVLAGLLLLNGFTMTV